jgi:hypothetical protein
VPAYRLCGLIVQSNVTLPELPADGGSPSCRFQVLRSGRVVRHGPWYHHWYGPGRERYLSFARTASGHLLRFPALADFEIARGCAHVRAMPRRGVPQATLRHLLLNQVWPLVLSGRGCFVIHASAVVLPDGRAIAFAGAAGVGKSSLAAALAAAGCPLLSDDCLLIEKTRRGWDAVPSYPGVRLWPDMISRFAVTPDSIIDLAHHTSKKRLNGSTLPFARRPAPLKAVYLVRPANGAANAHIAPVTGAAALMQLVPFTYLLDHEDPRQLERSFAHLGALSTTVPVRRLDLPHESHRLDALAALLMN